MYLYSASFWSFEQVYIQNIINQVSSLIRRKISIQQKTSVLVYLELIYFILGIFTLLEYLYLKVDTFLHVDNGQDFRLFTSM